MNTIFSPFSERLRGRQVILFWSGGTESTFLLESIIRSELYAICDLTILVVAFPQELYTKASVDKAIQFLNRYPIHTIVLSPEETITHDIPYSAACGICKTIRRQAITKCLNGMLSDRRESILITGHNLDDLASYTLELLVNRFQEASADQRTRFLECTNKFHEWFPYSDTIIFYRPLTSYPKRELRGADGDAVKIISESCYWLNQRKRIFQSYFSSSGIALSYEKVKQVFLQNFVLPTDEEFRELPYETYLM